MARFVVFVAMSVAAIAAAAEKGCRDQDSCAETGEPVRASAMLQVKAEPQKVDPASSVDTGNLLQSALCAPAELSAVHLQESRECISPELLEMHVKAVRRHAALLAAQERERSLKKEHKQKKSAQPSLEDMTTAPPKTAAPTPAPTAAPTPAPTAAPTPAPTTAPTPAPAAAEPVAEDEAPAAEAPAADAPAAEAPSASGTSAPLTAAGFKETTSLCCPAEMELFFNRLLESEGYDGCSVPHIQGLMHWFTCVPDMDFQYMLDVIEKGNPCKYWTKKGDECPVLSSECAGHFCR